MTFQEIINYIQANLTETITLEKLAELASLSPRHFSRKFKLYTQMSPNQYVIRCRVETAELLLLHTEIPIADIAILVGFHSQSHLNRHFKRILKVTPQILRQNKKEIPKKKKVVHKDSWKWLTNYIWIFLPRSIFERRINIKSESNNIQVKKDDLDLYQKIQGDIQNNHLNFAPEIVATIMLHYFAYIEFQSNFNNQKTKEIGLKSSEFITIESGINNQSNSSYFVLNIKYVQNVKDKLLSVFLGYGYSNISAILFNLKEHIIMRTNPVVRIKSQLLSNSKDFMENDTFSLDNIKEGIQDRVSDSKFPRKIVKTQLLNEISDGEFSPGNIKENIQDRVSDSEFPSKIIKAQLRGGLSNERFSPDKIKESIQDRISEGEFPRRIVRAQLLDRISNNKFSPSEIKEEIRDKISDSKLPFSVGDDFPEDINLGKFVDSFTGAELEKPFDFIFHKEFFPEVALPHNQLTKLDINSLNDGSNFDLIEFGSLEFPRPGYGIDSQLELPNHSKFDDFNFGEQRPFLNSLVLDEITSLVDAK